MHITIFKIFALFGVLSQWAETSLAPDEDGKVRVTAIEATDFIQSLADALGVTLEIEL